MHRKVPVRFGPGAARKRACTTGTSPAAYRCYYVLESIGLAVQLVSASQARNLKGRPKTDLLTELRARLGQVSGQAGISGANVCRHDHWRRSTAGVVRSGGAAVRFA